MTVWPGSGGYVVDSVCPRNDDGPYLSRDSNMQVHVNDSLRLCLDRRRPTKDPTNGKFQTNEREHWTTTPCRLPSTTSMVMSLACAVISGQADCPRELW